MTTPELNQVLQYVAWFIALIELMSGLYILLLNIWHTANRHVSLLVLMLSINTFAMGMLATATTADQARLPTLILSCVAPGVTPLLLLAAVVLVRPQWTQGKWRAIQRGWVWWPIYGLSLLPIVLTALDAALGTKLLYTGLDRATYQGGIVNLFTYVAGQFAPLYRVATNLPILILLIILIVVVADKRSSSLTRLLAALLMIAVLVGGIGQVALTPVVGNGVALVGSSTAFALVYAYAGFQQMVSERRAQRGNLQIRQMLLILAIAVPVLVAVAANLTNQAGVQLDRDSNEKIQLASQSLKNNVQTWLTLNIQIIQHVASLPDIVSMDPARQKPILTATKAAHPYLLLVHTTDLQGRNVARNDAGQLQDYGDRKWFQGSRAGSPITLEPAISRTSGRPVVNMGTPIKDASGNIVGVADMNSELDDISNQVRASKVGKTGVAYVVAADNRVVAHPDPAFSNELRDLSAYPPVAALRQGMTGHMDFVDEKGVSWHVYLDKLDNGWGILIQQENAEVSGALAALQQAAVLTILLGALVMAGMIWFTVRQSLQPIGTLTATATAIAAGELGRSAPVESQDEIGALARAFNSMTGQLRDLIGGLEQRVNERTADLERRSSYLQAASEVGRTVGSMLDRDQLIRQVVELIRERFGLYYVGLFLVDPAGEWAALQAGTGQAGQLMLARQHRLRLGGGSMIGWCVANAQPRIAQVAAQDAERLATAELPLTRSEAALPLRARGQAIGALTIQSDTPNAFDQTALSALQVMADQVAVALENARLFAESQAALETARRAYGELAREGWADMLQTNRDLGFRYARPEVVPADGAWRPDLVQVAESGQGRIANAASQPALTLPLKVRDQVIGVLDLRRSTPDRPWTQEDQALVQTLVDQLGSALESARLYQDTQRRAAREQLTGAITARMRESLDIDRVLQTAARELGEALQAARVNVRLIPGDESNGDTA